MTVVHISSALQIPFGIALHCIVRKLSIKRCKQEAKLSRPKYTKDNCVEFEKTGSQNYKPIDAESLRTL